MFKLQCRRVIHVLALGCFTALLCAVPPAGGSQFTPLAWQQPALRTGSGGDSFKGPRKSLVRLDPSRRTDSQPSLGLARRDSGRTIPTAGVALDAAKAEE
jgi:hypothetical protein